MTVVENAQRVRAVRAANARLAGQQKPGNGVPAYLRWVNRRLGRWCAALAHGLGLSPNAVSAISLAWSAVGMVILAFGAPTVPVAAAAAAALLIGYALDSADGQLARLTGASSARGEWFDHVADAFRLPAVHLAVAVGLFRREDVVATWPVALALAFACLSSVWFFAQVLAEKLQPPAARPGTDAPAWVSFAKVHSDVGTLYLLVLLYPWPRLFVLAYGALALATAVTAAPSMVRKYRSLSP